MNTQELLDRAEKAEAEIARLQELMRQMWQTK